MIASFLHNFIFLKTRKVGGTSLEIVLSSWCGEQDICTPITEDDERLRQRHGGAARNFRAESGGIRFYNHMPARDVRRALPDFWERAFKFTVDRHPYEKVVSRAWWNIGRRKGNSAAELSSEIEKAITSRSYLNYPIYMVDGCPVVDEVWRYEDMWMRVEALAKRVGTPHPIHQPQAKAGYRTDRRAGVEVLTEEQRRQIYCDARLEFELIGYEP